MLKFDQQLEYGEVFAAVRRVHVEIEIIVLRR